MNHKQKFGYTVLGATIMLIGLVVGVMVTPPIIAQRNSMFGEIQCTGLTVVDKNGEVAVVLGTDEKGKNGVSVHGKHGKQGVVLSADGTFNRLLVYDKNEKKAIVIGTSSYANSSYANAIVICDQHEKTLIGLTAIDGLGNGIDIRNKKGEFAIELRAREKDNAVTLLDRHGKQALRLFSRGQESNGVLVHDMHGKVAIALGTSEEGNGVFLSDTQGKNAVHLNANVFGNGIVVYDKYEKEGIGLATTELGNRVRIFDKAGNIKWTIP